MNISSWTIIILHIHVFYILGWYHNHLVMAHAVLPVVVRAVEDVSLDLTA